MARTKKEWQAIRDEAWLALHEIESRETDERNAALIGKCFRYRNSYGSDEKWWLYCKIIGTKEGHLIAHRFEITSRGEIQIVPQHEIFGGLSEGHSPISATEFAEAWHELQRQIATLQAG